MKFLKLKAKENEIVVANDCKGCNVNLCHTNTIEGSLPG